MARNDNPGISGVTNIDPVETPGGGGNESGDTAKVTEVPLNVPNH